MNLEQLRSFRAVAEAGGFKRAADLRGVAQPTISMQVAALERELDVRLFERLGWRVMLTAAGVEYLRYVTRILTLVEDARQAMEDIRGLAAGRLIVGASHTVGNHFVPEFFGRFSANHPGVRLVLEIAPTPQTAERVIEGSLDIGLVEANVSSPELSVRPFMTDDLVLIVPHEHRWGQVDEIDADELAHERFITREPGSMSRQLVEERLKALGVDLRPALELGTPEAIRGAVGAGLGVAIVSRQVANLSLAAGVVAEVRVRGLRLERDLFVILHREKHISPALAAFLEILGLEPKAGVQAPPSYRSKHDAADDAK